MNAFENLPIFPPKQNMDTNLTSKSNKENVGNCLIASQDCQPGEVILIDSPQVIGPNHVPLPGKKYFYAKWNASKYLFAFQNIS